MRTEIDTYNILIGIAYLVHLPIGAIADDFDEFEYASWILEHNENFFWFIKVIKSVTHVCRKKLATIGDKRWDGRGRGGYGRALTFNALRSMSSSEQLTLGARLWAMFNMGSNSRWQVERRDRTLRRSRCAVRQRRFLPVRPPPLRARLLRGVSQTSADGHRSG